ncbi:MAG TPA: hypothetical protein VFI44_11480 [Ornithinibacter sp.]|nr:hypothetical protein [Ornithinibacter sp.]
MTPPRTGGRDGWEVPDVAALRHLEPHRAPWTRALAHPRRVLATAILLPPALWAARTSLPPVLDPSAAWWATLALVAVLAASALATYVPLPRGHERREASPCASMAWALLVLAGLALGAAGSSVVSAVPALLLTALALRQRLVGVAGCGPAAR